MMPDTATLLYRRVEALADLDSDAVEVRNRSLHAALAQVCHEGVKDTGMAFGNLFSQVDYLCRSRAVGAANRQEIQTMRRHSNSTEPTRRTPISYAVFCLKKKKAQNINHNNIQYMKEILNTILIKEHHELQN